MSQEITFHILTDRSADPREYYYEEDLPAILDLGTEVQVRFYVHNHGPEEVSYSSKVWFEDPDKRQRGFREISGTISAGGSRMVSSSATPATTLDIPGWWQAHCTLNINGVHKDWRTWSVLRCVEPPPEGPVGTVEFSSVYVVDEARHYTSIPVSLPTGTTIQGCTRRRNTNVVRQWMKTISWLVDPDGQVRGHHETGWTDTGPGVSTTVHGSAMTIDKPGSWHLHAEVYAQIKVNGATGTGELVDSGQWHIIIADDDDEPPPPPPPPPGMDGELEFNVLIDRSTSPYTYYYEDDLPAELVQGTDVRASVRAHNHGPEEVSYTMQLWLEDPHGQSRGFREHSGTILPGSSRLVNNHVVTLDTPGWWMIHALLYFEGTLMDQRAWTALRCVEEEPPPPPPPPPEYVCPYCGATFDSQAELDAHIEEDHYEPPPPPPPPPPEEYVCPYCGEVFDSYEDLQAHIEDEHDEEPPPPPPPPPPPDEPADHRQWLIAGAGIIGAALIIYAARRDRKE